MAVMGNDVVGKTPGTVENGDELEMDVFTFGEECGDPRSTDRGEVSVLVLCSVEGL